jgi:dTDP-4-dehydrorhamnose 3,5-epimerase-like enzyme
MRFGMNASCSGAAGGRMSSRQSAERVASSRCLLVPLRRVDDDRGSLCVAETLWHVPFEIKRTYWVFDVPRGGERGHHAHREQQELLVAADGAFTVHADDGRVRTVHRLDSPAHGLFIPEMVWHHLDDFSHNALCVVLASGPYDESEYIRDHDDFRELTAHR